EPFPIYFEAEIFTEACYGGGFGFITTNTFKVYQYTPFDTFEKIIQENVRKQVNFLWPLLYNCVNIEEADLRKYPLNPKRVATDWGLITLTIQLATYDKITDWFRDYSHKDAIFLISVSGVPSSQQGVVVAGFTAPSSLGSLRSAVVQGATVGLFVASSGVSQGQVQQGALSTPLGFTMVAKPDARGRVVVKGIRPLTGIDVQAYVLDPKTGKIMCATDSGPFGTTKLKYGGLFGQASSAAAPTLTAGMEALVYLAASGEGARSFSLYAPPWWRYVPVINVSSIAIIGLLDPIDIRDAAGLTIEVYNFISHSYLIWRDTLSPWPETMAFVQPNVPVEILIKSGGKTIVVLNNASRKYPEGQGYVLKHGETRILTVFDAIDNMFYLAQSRAGFLMEKMSANPKLVLYLEKMNHLRSSLEEALQNRELSKFYSLSLACWQYSLNAYLSSFELTYDVANTASFFFFLSAIFIILVARLVARREAGIKRMMYIIALFIIVNSILGLIHPGYAISSNIWMLINGLAIILFSILLIYVVIGEFNDAVKGISQSILGYHKSDIERDSFIFSAFSLGIENLKKRYVRTGLTLSTIVITVLAMTMFTTMGLVITSYWTRLGTPAYTGFLLKKPLPDVINVPLSESYMLGIKDIVSYELGGFKVCPRVWIYPPGMKMFVTWSAQTKSSIRAILGITPEEAKLLEKALSSGTTFIEGAEKVAWISKALASQLSEDLGVEVKVGTSINVYGIPVTIVGILDDELGSSIIRDLDGGNFVPLNPTASLTSGAQVYLDVKEVLIVPYDFTKNFFNAQPNVIALHSDTPFRTEDLGQRAYELALIMPFDIFFGSTAYDFSGKVTTRGVYLVSGTENLLVPLMISALTILSMMLSAVYERTKEIAILSTLGLSPRHIGSIFLIESIALAFIGSFIGYITGAGLMTILWRLNLFPKELIPNVSSGVVIIVMGVIILVTILSSVYPILKASKLATPSLLRKWQIGSKPVEDRWSISLPFNATTSETIGVLEFLAEYFEATSTKERAGLFLLLKPAEIMQEDDKKILRVQLQLSPFDAGIIQDLEVICQKISADRYGFGILIKRLMGTESLWITSNRNLMNELRKQFLFWRALSPGDKAKYIDKGKLRQTDTGRA
ncbi:MAG: ABC transporter permease, partial [Thermoproteota archaeon]